jgi:hypothetical protein
MIRAVLASALRAALLAVGVAALSAAPVLAAAPAPGPPLTIQPVAGPIVLDGDLGDPGWQGAAPITQWFETRVGDGVEPQVANVGYLTFDGKFLYAAFRFADPNPRLIRAPIADHDALSGSTDYAGIIVDSHNDGKTAQMFLANANGLLYDAVTNDATGEDSSPDFFWEARGRVTESGWTLELRVPFSSLRYGREEAPTWGILLYRNYPRDRRYQFFTARMPRDVNCFVCNSSKLAGLSHLPHGSHLVVAPFTTAQRSDAPEAGLGSPLRAGEVETESGLDVKWSPSASLALDATIRPDFSQVESDAAQIVANERFALFFPEKRSFFLEGVDLFSTPLQAVYTRTITAPEAGVRATGRVGGTAYTALLTRDRGGGAVILPGAQGSEFAPQDFRSDVGIVRLRHDVGQSFVSVLGTTREMDGGGHNRVVGPDVVWRPRRTDSVRGQFLVSHTRTPNRPDLATAWDGRTLTDHAALVSWGYGSERFDWYVQGQDMGPDFRADNGFIPQVGYREAYLDAGWTTRPRERFLSRLRLFTTQYVDVEDGGGVLAQRVSAGAGMDGRWGSFLRVELNRDAFRVGDALLRRFRPYVLVQASPSRTLVDLSLESTFGQEIDFANAREGKGASIAAGASIRPGDHLELRLNGSRRWLDVDTPAGAGRLFTAEIGRVRATYNFTSRSFVRVIGQHVRTTRDPALFGFPAASKESGFSGSALFAYKLNWQTVLYAGYGDQREYSEPANRLEPAGRQAFAKLAYAWQI